MATLDGFYLNPHVSQFDGSPKQGANCVPASGANGANAATGGKKHLSAGQVRALVPPSQETNPNTPGWSIPDLVRSMAKIGVTVINRSGQGFETLTSSHHGGFYIAVQGDSDQFTNATCSGRFDGDHCIGIHPATRTGPSGEEEWWIDDPICPTGRWERVSVIRRYAQKLDPRVRFGVFANRVPTAGGAPHHAAKVSRTTHLWNDQTHLWRYTLSVGTPLVVRGAIYVKGGVPCYPVVGPPPYQGGHYYVPTKNVRLGSLMP